MSNDELLIQLAKSAWQYEMGLDTIYTDAEFDKLCLDLVGATFEDPALQEFMKTEFSPDTGTWVYQFPYLDSVKEEVEVL